MFFAAGHNALSHVHFRREPNISQRLPTIAIYEYVF